MADTDASTVDPDDANLHIQGADKEHLCDGLSTLGSWKLGCPHKTLFGGRGHSSLGGGGLGCVDGGGREGYDVRR